MKVSTAAATAQAEKDLEAAHEELASVVQRVADGDATEEDLDAAERRVRFCEARLEGTRRREAEAAEQERLRALGRLAERTRERVEVAEVEKAQRAAERALERYVAACVAHNASLDEAVGELLTLGDLPEGYGVATGSDGHSPTLENRAYRRIRPMVSVAEMAQEVLRRHIPHGYIDLERPY